jgi:hypothetical protein
MNIFKECFDTAYNTIQEIHTKKLDIINQEEEIELIKQDDFYINISNLEKEEEERRDNASYTFNGVIGFLSEQEIDRYLLEEEQRIKNFQKEIEKLRNDERVRRDDFEKELSYKKKQIDQEYYDNLKQVGWPDVSGGKVLPPEQKPGILGCKASLLDQKNIESENVRIR